MSELPDIEMRALARLIDTFDLLRRLDVELDDVRELIPVHVNTFTNTVDVTVEGVVLWRWTAPTAATAERVGSTIEEALNDLCRTRTVWDRLLIDEPDHVRPLAADIAAWRAVESLARRVARR